MLNHLISGESGTHEEQTLLLLGRLQEVRLSSRNQGQWQVTFRVTQQCQSQRLLAQGWPCPLDIWLSLTQISTPPPFPQALTVQKVPMTWVGFWGLTVSKCPVAMASGLGQLPLLPSESNLSWNVASSVASTLLPSYQALWEFSHIY